LFVLTQNEDENSNFFHRELMYLVFDTYSAVDMA